MTDLLIADEIARGGMGTVRLAFRRTGDFGRALALKRPSGGGPGDSSERELLLEARLNAMLRHPNIVEVLDVGVDDRGLYLVMDYVEGTGVGLDAVSGDPFNDPDSALGRPTIATNPLR